VIYFPNAKINLGLKVLGRRDDGYHEVKSLFLPAGWCDVLEVHVVENGVSGKLDFSSEGLSIEGDEKNNLVIKAYEVLSANFRLPEIKATLLKVIPTQAGLGGGSSDGSFMLKAINQLCSLGLSNDELRTYAAQLGSDCPFFIDNTPAMIEGRGEILSAPDFELDLEDFEVLIVHPGVGVSTAEAFKLLDQVRETTDFNSLCDFNKLSSTRLSEYHTIVENDFEIPVSQQNIEILNAIEFVKSAGTNYTQMSGSGSAVFGLFEKGKCDGLKLKSQAEDLGYTAHFGALL
jgi:4-diphosphocytidyl-2-C-methyl-D-erythritol kinase